MNQIDSTFKLLKDVPAEIREFYSEDTRTRVTGYTEGDDPQPITEPYTVIVLNKPNTVTYQYVKERRARRFGEDVVKTALQAAIDWEYFSVNHDQYLEWQEAYATWEKDQPTIETTDDNGDPVYTVVDAPIRPVVDIDERRSCYELKVIPNTNPYSKNTEEFSDVIYDDELAITRLYETEPLPQKQIDHLRKMVGVEFNGVMCSAHKEDFWGLSGIESWIRAGNDTLWDFKNGNQVLLTKDNIDDFYAVWVPFRASFFSHEPHVYDGEQ